MRRPYNHRYEIWKSRIDPVSRARAHGVAGWVRNCHDGAVEAVVEGPSDAVESVVRFFQTGPPRARVEDVEVQDEQPEGLSGFEVR